MDRRAATDPGRATPDPGAIRSAHPGRRIAAAGAFGGAMLALALFVILGGGPFRSDGAVLEATGTPDATVFGGETLPGASGSVDPSPSGPGTLPPDGSPAPGTAGSGGTTGGTGGTTSGG
ncbi:MAG: hypothetical protein AB1627_09075, partial [Chloroflexota bacterium]